MSQKSSKKRKTGRRSVKEKHFRDLAIVAKAKEIKRRLEETKRLKAEKRKFVRANVLWSFDDEEFDTEVESNG